MLPRLPTATAEPPEVIERRTALVERLRAARVLRTAAVEAAMRRVPRHLFVPAVPVERAYADEAIVTQTDPGEVPTDIVHWHGDAALLPALLAGLNERQPLDVGHLELIAFRHDDAMPVDRQEGQRWLLERSHHRFLVSVRQGA